MMEVTEGHTRTSRKRKYECLEESTLLVVSTKRPHYEDILYAPPKWIETMESIGEETEEEMTAGPEGLPTR